MASQVAQWVKSPPAIQEIQEMWVQSLVWEDPLEEGTATHSSILAWRIPMDRGAWQATVHGLQSQTWMRLPSMHTHVHIYYIHICAYMHVS